MKYWNEVIFRCCSRSLYPRWLKPDFWQAEISNRMSPINRTRKKRRKKNTYQSRGISQNPKYSANWCQSRQSLVVAIMWKEGKWGNLEEQWKRKKMEGEKTKNRNRRLPAHYALQGWDAYAVLMSQMTWFGVCRRIKRYKTLVEPAHKRTSPINRTRNSAQRSHCGTLTID